MTARQAPLDERESALLAAAAPDVAGPCVDPPELGAVELFASLPQPALTDLARQARVCRYPAGSTIFEEGDHGDCMHVLRSGAVKVVRPSQDDEDVVLDVLGPGKVFGELAGHNRALEDTVRERTEELRRTHLDIVRRLAQAAEWHDDTTGRHISRMSKLAQRLALAAGMDREQAEMLLQASALHDIGKIGIPDRVLLKPGKLDADEWELMKTHTTIGAQLLAGSSSEVVQMAERIALTHHERWDGRGYPHGLAGEDIPFESRICTIADVFDALMSERPYKKAWPVSDALAEIARMSGSAFEPWLAEVFLREVARDLPAD